MYDDSDANSLALSSERALKLLREGELQEAHGLLPWSSNYTFLMRIADSEMEALAVYKPRRGERPLWDFPDGTLCQREVAAYLVSEALGWHIVPPTLLRDGPHGPGSVQLFVGHDPEQNYFNFEPEIRPQLMRVALLDQLINNADRKGGHCLLDLRGQIWAIDHGICFHTQPKLRTVIWDFAGEAIPETLLNNVRDLCALLSETDLSRPLSKLLNRAEMDALQRRADQTIDGGAFCSPGPGRNYPWPPV
jgi:uncharacterized repeat protein (TIGR03843 family)